MPRFRDSSCSTDLPSARLRLSFVADDPDSSQRQVNSAGTKAGTALNALSVASLADIGVDSATNSPRAHTAKLQRDADLVVSVGEAEVEQLDGPRCEVWKIDEPRHEASTGPNAGSSHATTSPATSKSSVSDSSRPARTTHTDEPVLGRRSACGVGVRICSGHRR
jgi:hypothetical protein